MLDHARQLEALSEPLPVAEVKFKPQSVKGNRALAIAYIDARVVQDRLDEIVGVDHWKDDYEIVADGSVVCRLSVRLAGEWVTKVDVGSPSEQPDQGDRLKAAFSDALKRAAVKFGIGRYLYRLPNVWCDYDPQKRAFVALPKLPSWAIPSVSKPASIPVAYADPAPPEPPRETTRPPQPKKAGPPPATTVAELHSRLLALAAPNSISQLVAWVAAADEQMVRLGCGHVEDSLLLGVCRFLNVDRAAVAVATAGPQQLATAWNMARNTVANHATNGPPASPAGERAASPTRGER